MPTRQTRRPETQRRCVIDQGFTDSENISVSSVLPKAPASLGLRSALGPLYMGSPIQQELQPLKGQHLWLWGLLFSQHLRVSPEAFIRREQRGHSYRLGCVFPPRQLRGAVGTLPVTLWRQGSRAGGLGIGAQVSGQSQGLAHGLRLLLPDH